MGLRDEIQTKYLDQNGLVTPSLAIHGPSDNGTCFTSEYYILLAKRGELVPNDRNEFSTKIWTCFAPNKMGLLLRQPRTLGQDGPDNLLAVCAASIVLDDSFIPDFILHYGVRHLGFYNSDNPGSLKTRAGKLNLGAFLWRQPQLLTITLAGAKKLKWYHFPLTFYTALVILYAGLRNISKTDSDSWRLTWLLIQGMSKVSKLCKWSSKYFYKQLYEKFLNGMTGVAETYYEKDHPFIRFWKS